MTGSIDPVLHHRFGESGFEGEYDKKGQDLSSAHTRGTLGDIESVRMGVTKSHRKEKLFSDDKMMSYVKAFERLGKLMEDRSEESGHRS